MSAETPTIQFMTNKARSGVGKGAEASNIRTVWTSSISCVPTRRRTGPAAGREDNIPLICRATRGAGARSPDLQRL